MGECAAAGGSARLISEYSARLTSWGGPNEALDSHASVIRVVCSGHRPQTRAEPRRDVVASSSSDDYTLVWADEFNTNGTPDARNWKFEKGFVRNREQQWYQPENARCENGLLVTRSAKAICPELRARFYPGHSRVFNQLFSTGTTAVSRRSGHSSRELSRERILRLHESDSERDSRFLPSGVCRPFQ